METIIGRATEKKLLLEIAKSGDAELVAIYGRRRVGKTFLVRNGFSLELAFEFSGIQHATLDQQLEEFSLALTTLPDHYLWLKAFEMLKQYLTPLVKKQRTVVFMDEFPG